MKRLLTILFTSFIATTAMAQYGSTGNASQATTMALGDVIEIVFAEVNSEKGNTVFMPFTSSRDFKEGVTFNDQELRVRANTAFKVSLKYDLNTFAYIGAESVTADVLRDALGVMVTQNQTGGQVAAPYNAHNFTTINSSDRDLLINGLSGGNQRFAIKYKCAPKRALPVGNYFINVVYTATKN